MAIKKNASPRRFADTVVRLSLVLSFFAASWALTAEPGTISADTKSSTDITVEADAAASDTGAATDAAVTAASQDYYFQLTEEGVPVFTQVIRWEANTYALEYELEIQDEKKAEVFKARTPGNEQTVSLPAGNFMYRLTVYNLLGKAEVAGDWIPLLIKKAVQPQVISFSPSILYLEENNYSLSLRCKKFEEGARVFLVDPNFGLTKFEASIAETDGDRIALTFPLDKLDSGNFLVKVVNPGGLFSASQDIFKVKYKNPYELFVTLGYSAMIPLYDTWYTGIWSNSFYPVGLVSRVSFVALKKRYGYFGVEATASIHACQGGPSETVIKTVYTGIGINFLYKYMMSDKFFFIFRAGPGITLTSLEFDYSGTSGQSLGSMDLNATAGLAFQYLINKHWVAELGTDYTNIFYKKQNTGLLLPQLSAGYLF